MLGQNLSLGPIVNAPVSLSHYYLKLFRKMLPFMDADSLVIVNNAIIHGKLDYFNLLIASAPKNWTHALQGLQNTTARIVCSVPSWESIFLVLNYLHWLHVASRIKLTMLLLIYKSLQVTAPKYLIDRLCPLIIHRTLYSNSNGNLAVPRFRCSTIGGRSISVQCAAGLGNELPDSSILIECVFAQTSADSVA